MNMNSSLNKNSESTKNSETITPELLIKVGSKVIQNVDSVGSDFTAMTSSIPIVGISTRGAISAIGERREDNSSTTLITTRWSSTSSRITSCVPIKTVWTRNSLYLNPKWIYRLINFKHIRMA